MTIIAAFSIKGGVGKSTAAANLAYLAARAGKATLLFDLDPQGAASYFFRIRPKVKGGVEGLLGGEQRLHKRIKGSDFENLDLLPADLSYRHFDLAFDDMKKRRSRLRKMLSPLGAHYDFVFLDCPPNLTLLAENVFRAADALLVPLIPTPSPCALWSSSMPSSTRTGRGRSCCLSSRWSMHGRICIGR